MPTGVSNPPLGINRFYGHRDEGIADPADQYLPGPRLTACRYSGKDFPSITGKAGTRYTIELDFLGQIVDTCNETAVIVSAEWAVSCSGVL